MAWLAGSAAGEQDQFPPVPDNSIARYTARRVAGELAIDGRLDEPAWRDAERSSRFVDLISGARAVHDTRAAVLWDDQFLYVGYWIDEPFVRAKFTERDSPIYQDNDVELFIAGADAYYEFEINAHGTLYEGLFVWQDAYERAGFIDIPELDRRRTGVRSQPFNGVGLKNHPRGKRWAFLNWDFPDARTAVAIDGTLNDDTDRDRGWTVELALPWRSMKTFAASDGRAIPPRGGDVWRMDFSRFNQYREAPPAQDSGGWAWSAHGVWDSHVPECFPYITFSSDAVTTSDQCLPSDDEPALAVDGRVAWTTSRVTGFPDPPPPYRTERLYPQLKIERPLTIVNIPNSDQMLVAQHFNDWGGPGRILRFSDHAEASAPVTFLDRPEIMYGMAFHPRFDENGWLYIGGNGKSEALGRVATRVLRITMDRQAPYQVDPDSVEVVIEWPSDGHNGGDLAFGPDGMLYVTAGDGTSDSDTLLNGQNLETLPGSVLRINVDLPDGPRPYSIPADNPFRETKGARPEIWAYGLRNPWRMTFDAKTGQLWVGNNGQDMWETVHLIRRGENYGWSVMEGSHPFQLARTLGPSPAVLPTAEHHHAEARSLTGGVVYYGSRNPELRGAYLYGDYSTGIVWGIRHDGNRVVWQQQLARTGLQISGFGVDSGGEPVVVDHGGGFYRLGPNDEADASHQFPGRLSETGLFESTADHRLHPGVIPYSVNAPLWSDGALKQRAIAIPNNGHAAFRDKGAWQFPDGTVLVKTFSLADSGGMAHRRVETRLLTRHGGQWYGYSYEWTADQTDATLVTADGQDRPFQTPAGDQTWRFPSRSECMVCHTRAADFVLGLNVLQMNKRHDYGDAVADQLATLASIGLFAPGTYAEKTDSAARPALVDPSDPSNELDARARSYLHANCAACHTNAGGGNSAMLLDYDTALGDMKILDVEPQHDTYALPRARIVAPGDAERSVMILRLNRRGTGQMPPLSTHTVDVTAVEMLRQWIQAMAQPQPD